MNKINEALFKIKEYNVMEHLKVEDLESKMIEEAYNKKKISDLVSLVNLNQNTLNIADYTYGSDYEIDTHTRYSPKLSSSFRSEEEYEEAIEDIKDDEDFDEEWEDLEIEYDEIYWNDVFNFDGGEINELNAIAAGLGVLTISDNYESYLFLKGCGMDMSFAIMDYIIRTYNGLTRDYATESKIDWLKANVSKDVFVELMVLAGLEKEKVLEIY